MMKLLHQYWTIPRWLGPDSHTTVSHYAGYSMEPSRRIVLCRGTLVRVDLPRLYFMLTRTVVSERPLATSFDTLRVGELLAASERETVVRTGEPNLWPVCFGDEATARVERGLLDPFEAFWMTDFKGGLPYFCQAPYVIEWDSKNFTTQPPTGERRD